jgi:hypothetical protein
MELRAIQEHVAVMQIGLLVRAANAPYITIVKMAQE